jgi:hypothetical protein
MRGASAAVPRPHAQTHHGADPDPFGRILYADRRNARAQRRGRADSKRSTRAEPVSLCAFFFFFFFFEIHYCPPRQTDPPSVRDPPRSTEAPHGASEGDGGLPGGITPMWDLLVYVCIYRFVLFIASYGSFHFRVLSWATCVGLCSLYCCVS